MNVQAVWVVKVVPDDEAEELHEFSLSWYRFTNDPAEIDPTLKIPARPAVWVKFSKVEHLELMQSDFPDAKLGPASSFTEALLFADDWDRAQALQKKVTAVLKGEDGDEMGRILKEDAMEDY
jgi:hypothetical protein